MNEIKNSALDLKVGVFVTDKGEPFDFPFSDNLIIKRSNIANIEPDSSYEKFTVVIILKEKQCTDFACYECDGDECDTCHGNETYEDTFNRVYINPSDVELNYDFGAALLKIGGCKNEI